MTRAARVGRSTDRPVALRGAGPSPSRVHEVRVRRSAHGGVVCLTLVGEWDHDDVPELTAELDRVQDAYLLVVDLQDCSFADTTVVELLGSTALTAAGSGRQVLLADPTGATELVVRLLDLSHLVTSTAGDWQSDWR